MLNNVVELSLEASFAAAPAGPGGPSPRVVEVAAMFGLGADQSQSLDVVSKTQVTLRPDQLVFVTGASGSGKSTLLRLMAQGLAGRGAEGIAVIDFAGLALPTDRAVVDAVDDGRLPLDRVLKILSLTGLNDAFVMLRRPSELSDGQRYRFQLARTMARVEESLLSESNDTDNANDSGDSKNDAGTSGAASGPGLTVVLADEFGATLDRTTAPPHHRGGRGEECSAVGQPILGRVFRRGDDARRSSRTFGARHADRETPRRRDRRRGGCA